MDYSNKLLLAPMVRVGTLPFRICALRHGADIVFSEEIVDKKIVHCQRIVNTELDTEVIEYVYEGKVVYSTCKEEEGKNVFQIGTANAITGLAGAEVVAKDIAALDVNMGCPKPFSTSGGMGAALLDKPELIYDILTTLKRNLPIPVTAKIRILPDEAKTLQLVKMIESTGVSAITIHARTRDMRKEEPAIWDRIKLINETPFSIPIIHNGDIYTREDIVRCKKETGVTSLMLARGALFNLAVFGTGTIPAPLDLAKEFLMRAIDFDLRYQPAKYTAAQMLTYHPKDQRTARMNQGKSLLAVYEPYGVDDYYRAHLRKKELRNNKTMITGAPLLVDEE